MATTLPSKISADEVAETRSARHGKCLLAIRESTFAAVPAAATVATLYVSTQPSSNKSQGGGGKHEEWGEERLC